MLNEADLNILICNVVSENHFSHCRLCLKDIHENYVRLEDYVSSEPEQGNFRPLAEVLSSLLGDEVTKLIPGIDAVCSECVDKALESSRFVEKYNNSNLLLHKIFDNITETLNIDIETTKKDHQSLYVIVGENESKIVLLEKKAKRSKSHNMKQKQPQLECHECEEEFESIIDLRVHNLACHCTITCERCHQTFNDETELEVHKSCDHKYKCTECDQYKTSEEALKDHQDKVHTVYVCKECGKSCRGLEKLNYHEEKHIAKSECPKCGKSYITKDFFARHVKLCLEDRIEPHPYRGKIEKSYFCEKCGKGYSTPGGLRVHDRFVHGNAKPHICKHCGKKFTAPSYLKIHMVKHTGEKNFKCNICSNNFVSKEALLYHTRRHTGEKPYSCQLCSERFVNSSARAEHMKFKHAAPMLTCEICSRKFFTANFLRQHKSRHHDPSSKLYSGRNLIPPNIPGEQNMRLRVGSEDWVEES